MEKERRKEPRKILMFYTRVFDELSGDHIGHLGDLNQIGLMVISQLPIPVGKSFDIKIELPSGEFAEEHLVLTAKSAWSDQDVDPVFWCTGFEITAKTSDQSALIDRIMNRYGIR